jgi:hypothetical protein
VGLATLPLDRFVSLAASFAGGTVLTRPLAFSGKVLHLNAAARFGEILVELLDAAGHVVARSRPLRRDALDMPVEWESGGMPAAGTPVTARFTLKNARLFALWAGE